MQVPTSNKLPPPKSGKMVTLILVSSAILAAIIARQFRVSRVPPIPPTTQSTTDEAN